MPTTRYIYSNGVKIAQVKDGVRTDYLTDALGSITATKNQSQQIVNTYRYKPYGGLLARTGAGADPKYLWTGNTGSRVTNTRFANQYNVARHYANGPAKWTTVDPLVFNRKWVQALGRFGGLAVLQTLAYNYSGTKPTTYVDPSGLASQLGCPYCSHTNHNWAPPPIPTIQPPPIEWVPPGPISIEGCISMEIPTPLIIAGAQVSFLLKICKECYDTRCCPPGSASSCTSFGIGVELEWGLSLLDPDDLDLENLLNQFEIMGGLFAGLAFMGLACADGEKTRECVPTGERFELEICLGLCMTMAFVGGCCTFGAKSACGVKNSLGFCGAPGLTLEITGSKETCQ